MQHLLEELAWLGVTEITMHHDTHYPSQGPGGARYVEHGRATIEATLRTDEARLEAIAAVVRIARTLAPDDYVDVLRLYAAQALLVSKEGGS